MWKIEFLRHFRLLMLLGWSIAIIRTIFGGNRVWSFVKRVMRGSPLSLPSKKCIVCSRTINYNNHIMPTGNGNATKILFSSRFSGSIMRSIWDVLWLDKQAKRTFYLYFPLHYSDSGCNLLFQHMKLAQIWYTYKLKQLNTIPLCQYWKTLKNSF